MPWKLSTVVHKTYTLADHVTVRTLCGITAYADHAKTRQEMTSGPWESCPLCEAASLLDAITLTPPKTPGKWIQPALQGMENI
ncbi:hypothetical protein JS532_05350 [Bifidobacterium callimiconis]|uniref:hypothetical protein n=1 Tax=Bifidobacterium callimiconis TaxID=2306973 RepID=UPI001BDD01BD|nr:hypothetical protein [Bifidobacterium callimiconis]MBT1176997.1 hypothetical protein [Bifidobacterium callimiconis]